MRAPRCLALACAVAIVVPLWWAPAPAIAIDVAWPPWPALIEGRSLRPLPLGEFESHGLAEFPGRVARFTDGERDLALRQVAGATRWLHPASDCYRGLGFEIGAPGVQVAVDGERWRVFTAVRGDQHLRVRERIEDQAGGCWTDVSSWYWDATLGRGRGPYLAITIVERH